MAKSSTKTKSNRKPAPKPATSQNDWRDQTLARMRALILEADPAMIEERKWRKPSNAMAGVPVWSHNGIVCTGETYTKVVKLTFAKGASLPDPARLQGLPIADGAVARCRIERGLHLLWRAPPFALFADRGGEDREPLMPQRDQMLARHARTADIVHADGRNGLVRGADGSLDVWVSASPPASGTANWLPAPDGEFVLMLRTYLPADPSWAPPPAHPE